jgi:hypothetical protein
VTAFQSTTFSGAAAPRVEAALRRAERRARERSPFRALRFDLLRQRHQHPDLALAGERGEAGREDALGLNQPSAARPGEEANGQGPAEALVAKRRASRGDGARRSAR